MSKLQRTLLAGLVLVLMVAVNLVAWNAARAQSAGSHVAVATISGVIDEFTDGYVERVINVARADGAHAIVFQLDTPGGDLESTRKIIEQFFNSPVPIIVYVSPSGARAGSAGSFLAYGAHLAAMAPGTNIGAAHPVDSNGQDIPGTLGTKVTNDAAAFMRTIATQRGRNADWAEDAVRNSVSATEQEALQKGIINFVATDVPDLLKQADGHTVQVQGKPVTLQTANASLEPVDMNFFETFFQFLLNPDIALILLNVGTLCILLELYHPGAVLPAVIGVICLTLAAVALYGLPTNWAAVILIVAGIAMMILDVKVTGIALTVGGIIAFVLGAFFLFRPFTPTAPAPLDISVSPLLIGGLTLLTALFFALVLTAAIRARRLPVISGIGPLLGSVGVTKTALNPQGTVLVRSEEWSAMADGAPIASGEEVQVRGIEGLTLHVAKMAK